MRLITVVAGSDSANNSFSDTQRLLEYDLDFMLLKNTLKLTKNIQFLKFGVGSLTL